MSFLWDFRYVVRGLVRDPAFSFAVMFTFLLGIGMNTAVYSLVRGVVLKPLPYEDPESLVLAMPDRTLTKNWLRIFEAENTCFSKVAGFNNSERSFFGEVGAERIRGGMVSAGYFEVLGHMPALGRGFDAQEELPESEDVVIVSHRFWMERLAGDPDVLGKPIPLEGRNAGDRPILIGVMPVDFQPIHPQWSFWVPIIHTGRGGPANLRLLGRLAPEKDMAAADAEMKVLLGKARETSPTRISEEQVATAHVVPLKTYILGEEGNRLLVLQGITLLVLIMACVNVGNLLSARCRARRHETAVRSALGASVARLWLRPLLEVTLPASLGGLLAVPLVVIGNRLLLPRIQPWIPRAESYEFDSSAVLFALLAAFVTGVLSALPMLQTLLGEPLESLSVRGASRGRGDVVWGKVLVSVEVALSLVVVVFATFISMTYFNLRETDPGFTNLNTYTVKMDAPGDRYPENADRARLFRDISTNLRRQPGVRQVGLVGSPALAGLWSNWGIYPQGIEVPEGQAPPRADQNLVTGGYFLSMGIPLLRGRFMTPADHRDSGNLVAVVNQSFVDRYWPGEDGLDKTVEIRDAGNYKFRVVGVVADVKQRALDETPDPAFYTPLDQWGYVGSMYLTVHSDLSADDIAEVVRSAALEVEPGTALSDPATMEERIREGTGRGRLFALLLVVFAGLALLLGMIGIYGVTAYNMARATRALGVRAALGAEPADLRRYALRTAMNPVWLGLGLGLIAAVCSGFSLEAFLYGISILQPLPYLAAMFVLALSAFAAAWPVARTAAEIDPGEALRVE